jgi:hypothetical protein
MIYDHLPLASGKMGGIAALKMIYGFFPLASGKLCEAFLTSRDFQNTKVFPGGLHLFESVVCWMHREFCKNKKEAPSTL